MWNCEEKGKAEKPQRYVRDPLSHPPTIDDLYFQFDDEIQTWILYCIHGSEMHELFST